MSETVYKTSAGIENAVHFLRKPVIRVEYDMLYDAMCILATHSAHMVITFTVKPVFLNAGLVFDVSVNETANTPKFAPKAVPYILNDGRVI